MTPSARRVVLGGLAVVLAPVLAVAAWWWWSHAIPANGFSSKDTRTLALLKSQRDAQWLLQRYVRRHGVFPCPAVPDDAANEAAGAAGSCGPTANAPEGEASGVLPWQTLMDEGGRQDYPTLDYRVRLAATDARSCIAAQADGVVVWVGARRIGEIALPMPACSAALADAAPLPAPEPLPVPAAYYPLLAESADGNWRVLRTPTAIEWWHYDRVLSHWQPVRRWRLPAGYQPVQAALAESALQWLVLLTPDHPKQPARWQVVPIYTKTLGRAGTLPSGVLARDALLVLPDASVAWVKGSGKHPWQPLSLDARWDAAVQQREVSPPQDVKF